MSIPVNTPASTPVTTPAKAAYRSKRHVRKVYWNEPAMGLWERAEDEEEQHCVRRVDQGTHRVVSAGPEPE